MPVRKGSLAIGALKYFENFRGPPHSICLNVVEIDAPLTCPVEYRTIASVDAMGMPVTIRSSRVEARLAPEALALVRRAAELQGRSISDFLVSAAEEAARKAIADVEVIRLSREAQEQFAAALLNPPKPAPALVRAFARRRKLIVEA